jgi:uncharacterized protein YyaL (SSP411 family)
MFKILLLGLLIMIPAQANRLLHEDSPYLQQHAHNPVDWYPWGKEAFAKAKKEDKLIFLSIGYSTCHWCHVMERESFEDDSVATILNKDFISIKVDREEYPHIDRHYQDIYALMNRRGGGWPLTIVMTPDKRVFFSATYMPADDNFGRAGLKGMLKVLHRAYHDKKEEVLKSASSIEAAMARMGSRQDSLKSRLDKSISTRFVKDVEANFDSMNKGIGDAPKFPHATTIDTLLDIYRIGGDKKALQMAVESLDAMSRGGIYDQIEGGFYRYSTDATWMIPHFEKMLYTNAELLFAYANAYALTKEARFKMVIQESVQNINERFYKDGMYYSASDADSDGQEGKYFVFDYHDSLKDLQKGGLSKEEAKAVLTYFSIYKTGNFEHEQTNPYLSGAQAPKMLAKAKEILRANRKKKNYPFIDYKIQTSWNALYIVGLFKAGKWVDKKYNQEALHSLDSLVKNLYKDRVLYHQVIVGKSAKVKGYLEDYAFLIDALIFGYQVDFKEHYLTLAKQLMEDAIKRFYKNSTWYMSDDTFEAKAAFHDASYVSAKVIMIEDIFKIALLSEDLKLHAFAQKSLEKEFASVASFPSQYPSGVRVILANIHGWVVLKSTKSNLEQSSKQIDMITYPYLLKKPHNDKNFSACKIDQCFAIDKKLKNVILKIDNL